MPVSPMQHRANSQSKIKPSTPTKPNLTQPNIPVDLSPATPLVHYFTILTIFTLVLLPISSCWLVHQPLLPFMGGGDEGWGSPHADVVGYHISRTYSSTVVFNSNGPPTWHSSDSTRPPGDSTLSPMTLHRSSNCPDPSSLSTHLSACDSTH